MILPGVSERGVENGGEGYRQPELEEAVPEDRYSGLGSYPEQGERGEHSCLEYPYTPRSERYRRKSSRYPVGHKENEGIGRQAQGREHEDQAEHRQRSFAPLLKRAGLPYIRFHELRHTTATLLLSRGVHPKFVQELLGHASVAITLDTYSHAVPGMGDQTAAAMEDALS